MYTYPDEHVTSGDMIATFSDFAHVQFGAFFRRALAESLDGFGRSSYLQTEKKQLARDALGNGPKGMHLKEQEAQVYLETGRFFCAVSPSVDPDCWLSIERHAR